MEYLYRIGSRRLILAGILVAALLVTATDSEAIPVFSRKYETSCTTCHVAFPKLNAFGEAFRLNGFQFPEDVEEEMKKEQDVSLGAESYKRVWPDATWPGAIPGNPPLAIRAISGFSYQKDAQVDKNFLAPSLNLLIAGTLGENISFYTGAHLFEEGQSGSIDRAYLQINNIFSSVLPSMKLNLRLGQFIPYVVPFSNHRSITLTPFAMNAYSPVMGSQLPGGHAHGTEGFALENFQLGGELMGIIRGRFRFAAGLVNGNGPGGDNNSAKDGYLRAAFKIGGLAFDGTGGEGTGAMSTGDNWKENSIRIGGFGYWGGMKNTAVSGPQDLEFHRYGLDVSLYVSSLNLFGGFITGTDQLMTSDVLTKPDYNLWFLQADMVTYPWLIGALRYERVSADGMESINRIVPHCTMMARANVKLVLETMIDPDDAEFDNLQVRFDFAF